MPQLNPLFFTHQLYWGFALLSILIWLVSSYLLPQLVRVFLTRTFITKI